MVELVLQNCLKIIKGTTSIHADRFGSQGSFIVISPKIKKKKTDTSR